MQNKLYQETVEILPDPNGSLDLAALTSKATYTRAVLKESLRLNPISIGVGRNLNSDMILSGFHVPKGVGVSTSFITIIFY